MVDYSGNRETLFIMTTESAWSAGLPDDGYQINYEIPPKNNKNC